MKSYESHEYADIFPMMGEEDFNNLKKDIQENGFDSLRPIILYEGKILDGRNRYKAIKELGEIAVFKEYNGDDPLYYVISNNLNRRHLNESQRTVVAVRMANLKLGDNQFKGMPKGTPSVSIERAAEEMSVSPRQIFRVKELMEKKPEVIKQIELGTTTVGKEYGDLKREEALTPDWLRYLDVWNFKDNTGDGLSNLPPEIIKNLLYYFTREGDKVSDPFAGSGLTYKVCEEMKRKCVCSDINPKEAYIIKADATKLPLEMKGSKLIFLDPPYWDMVDYGDGWGKLSLKEFYKKFEAFVDECDRVLANDGYIALIIMPLDREEGYIDLGFECYKLLQKKFKIHRRLCVPLTRNWALDSRLKKSKEEHKILVSSLRDLIIFKKQ